MQTLKQLTRKENATYAPNGSNDLRVFWTLLVSGFLVILIGIIVLAVASSYDHNGSAGFGAVVFIGPFPIIVGAGPDAVWMVLFGTIIAVLSIITFLLTYRKVKKSGS